MGMEIATNLDKVTHSGFLFSFVILIRNLSLDLCGHHVHSIVRIELYSNILGG